MRLQVFFLASCLLDLEPPFRDHRISHAHTNTVLRYIPFLGVSSSCSSVRPARVFRDFACFLWPLPFCGKFSQLFGLKATTAERTAPLFVWTTLATFQIQPRGRATGGRMSLHSRNLFAPFRQKFHHTFPTFLRFSRRELVFLFFSQLLHTLFHSSGHFLHLATTKNGEEATSFFLASRRHTLPPIRSGPFLRPRRHTPREQRKNMGKIFFTSEKRERT